MRVGGGGGGGSNTPPHTHTHLLASPVTINAKTTVHCSPGSSMEATYGFSPEAKFLVPDWAIKYTLA
jgi:hypothetical protein